MAAQERFASHGPQTQTLGPQPYDFNPPQLTSHLSEQHVATLATRIDAGSRAPSATGFQQQYGSPRAPNHLDTLCKLTNVITPTTDHTSDDFFIHECGAMAVTAKMRSSRQTAHHTTTASSMHDDALLLLDAATSAAHRIRSESHAQCSDNNTSEKASNSVNVNIETSEVIATTTPPFAYADLVKDNEMTSAELRGLVPDVLYISMAQMRLCSLSPEDRIGNYKHHEVGFVGMCCKHCGGLPGFGRHFPGSFESLLSGSHCQRIVKHIRSDCRSCPPMVRSAVQKLSQRDESANVQCNHGSRKRFVAYIWAQLRKAQSEENPAASPDDQRVSDDSTEYDSAPVYCGKKISNAADRPFNGESHIEEEDAAGVPWRSIFRGNNLVEEKDRHLVPDTTLFAISQMNHWPLTAADQIGRHRDLRLGFIGLCCKHCGGRAGKPRYGRYFPTSLKALAKPASCDRIVNHLASECPKCPRDIRGVMRELQLTELQQSVRYGSRNIFFQRLWSRLQKYDTKIAPPPTACRGGRPTTATVKPDPHQSSTGSRIPWKLLTKGSMLVTMNDIGRIPDSQLVAIAQLEACRVTPADRVGWYKDRPVGFGGLCCRHCGGRPGVGRYFPNALRTFSQNNYCQIVGNHLVKDCTGCPVPIRRAIVKLLHDDTLSANNKILDGRSSFTKGSRKACYDRIWSLMHSTCPTTVTGKRWLSTPGPSISNDAVSSVDDSDDGSSQNDPSFAPTHRLIKRRKIER